MHACLMVGDRELMGADSPPEHQEETKGFSVNLAIDDPVEAERINSLSPTMRQACTMQLNPYLMFNGQCEAAFKF